MKPAPKSATSSSTTTCKTCSESNPQACSCAPTPGVSSRLRRHPVYDDGLDLSVRARLAGYRVVVAPTSRVRFAQLGVAGPRIERSRRVLRVAHREARTAQLHRRIAYASAFAAFFMWLALPLVAVLRVALGAHSRAAGQYVGRVRVGIEGVLHPRIDTRVAKTRVREASRVGWSAVRPLRIDQKSVRTARMIDREAILVSQGRLRDDLQFVSTGGLGVLLFAVVAALVMTWWAITQTSLSGGALAPLQLARRPVGEHAHRRRGAGRSVHLGARRARHAHLLEPLARRRAVSHRGDTARLARRLDLGRAADEKTTSGRALVALAWAFSPVLLGSLAAGRLPTLILAVVLPWLLLSATRARSSWSWAGTASLLAAVALACAPVLIPAAVVLLVAGLLTSPRGIARVLTVALAPVVLFAPKLLLLLRGGNPLDLLLDPGIVSAYRPSSPGSCCSGSGVRARGLGQHLRRARPRCAACRGARRRAAGADRAARGRRHLHRLKVHFTILHAVLGGVDLLTAVGASKLQLLSIGSKASRCGRDRGSRCTGSPCSASRPSARRRCAGAPARSPPSAWCSRSPRSRRSP